DQPHVWSLPHLASWLESDSDAVGSRVVVLGGGKCGLSIADLCARRGREVSIVEPTHVFGVELGLPGRWRLVADLEAAGVRLIGNANVTRITADTVEVSLPDGRTDDVPADAVIDTASVSPDQRLADDLQAAGVTAHVVGDAAGIRRIEGANLDAAQLALTLS